MAECWIVDVTSLTLPLCHSNLCRDCLPFSPQTVTSSKQKET